MSFDKGFISKINSLPSTILSLDLILGVGGLPFGRIIEIFGPESSGKTTVCLSFIKSVQGLGKNAVYIDTEHCFDSNYAKNLGVDLSKLILVQPECGEDAFNVAEYLIKSKLVSLVIIDSVAALVPRAELEGDFGVQSIGGQARLMSQALRKLTYLLNKTGTAFIFTNQIRSKINVGFGINNETTPGGRALKFFSSIRVDLRRVLVLKNHLNIVEGVKIKAKTVKNKMAPPYKECTFNILYGKGKGVDSLDFLIDTCLLQGKLITKKGSWFYHNESLLGQGKKSVYEYIKKNQTLLSLIIKETEDFLFQNE
jgi:recombination protein RecA